jgi:hypothetical protein
MRLSYEHFSEPRHEHRTRPPLAAISKGSQARSVLKGANGRAVKPAC